MKNDRSYYRTPLRRVLSLSTAFARICDSPILLQAPKARSTSTPAYQFAPPRQISPTTVPAAPRDVSSPARRHISPGSGRRCVATSSPLYASPVRADHRLLSALQSPAHQSPPHKWQDPQTPEECPASLSSTSGVGSTGRRIRLGFGFSGEVVVPAQSAADDGREHEPQPIRLLSALEGLALVGHRTCPPKIATDDLGSAEPSPHEADVDGYSSSSQSLAEQCCIASGLCDSRAEHDTRGSKPASPSDDAASSFSRSTVAVSEHDLDDLRHSRDESVASEATQESDDFSEYYESPCRRPDTDCAPETRSVAQRAPVAFSGSALAVAGGCDPSIATTASGCRLSTRDTSASVPPVPRRCMDVCSPLSRGGVHSAQRFFSDDNMSSLRAVEWGLDTTEDSVAVNEDRPLLERLDAAECSGACASYLGTARTFSRDVPTPESDARGDASQRTHRRVLAASTGPLLAKRGLVRPMSQRSAALPLVLLVLWLFRNVDFAAFPQCRLCAYRLRRCSFPTHAPWV